MKNVGTFRASKYNKILDPSIKTGSSKKVFSLTKSKIMKGRFVYLGLWTIWGSLELGMAYVYLACSIFVDEMYSVFEIPCELGFLPSCYA